MGTRNKGSTGAAGADLTRDRVDDPGSAESGTGRPLPRFRARHDAPRDLRTAEELKANGYSQLGPACAELGEEGQAVLLYSTSEARLLKHSLWPRGPKLARPEQTEQSDGGRHAPLGGGRRLTNPGSTSEPLPGQPRRASPFDKAPRGAHSRKLSADPRKWISDLFGGGFVVLDTETTGLGRGSEIIEIAVLDSSGEALLETRVWPRSGRVPQASTRVHGLTLNDLQGAPTWPEVLLELERQLGGRRVLAWNAPFDERMTHQTSRLWSLVPRLPEFECAMRGYAHARGIGTLSMRLERAAQVERVLTSAQQHRSLGDTELVLAVLKRLLQAGTVPA